MTPSSDMSEDLIERLKARPLVHADLVGGLTYSDHDAELDRRLAALLTSRAAEIEVLREALKLASDTITAVIEIAGQARDEWDAAPAGMRAGKILNALAGDVPGYRIDIDAIHANRDRITALHRTTDHG